MAQEPGQDERTDILDRVFDRAIRITHKVGLKKPSRWLSGIQMKRWLEARHSVARDDEDNERTTPPDDEHIELHSVWIAEVYPPSSSKALGDALRRLPRGGIVRDQDLVDDVARARRYPLGGWWWNLGVFYNKAGDRRVPGSDAIELPPQVDHLLLTMYLVTPSLACAVGQFVLNDSAASNIESTLRRRYATEGVRSRDGSVRVRDPLTFKRELVASAIDELHDDCKAWFGRNLPGAFCDGLLEDQLPACYFLTLDKVRPLTDEARLDYLDPLGVDAGYMALASDDLPGLRLSQPVGVNRRPHTLYLAGKTDEMFPDDDVLGGHGRGRGGFTVALHMKLNRFIAMWGLERALLGYEMAFGRLRDSFSASHGSSIRRSLASLGVASSNIAQLGGDAHAVARDAQRLARDRHAFERELVTFRPVQPEMWRLEGTWTDVMRDDIAMSAERVRDIEASARDLEVTRASMISTKTNLSLQVSLRRLTIFLVVLTVVLVVIAWATLDAMN